MIPATWVGVDPGSVSTGIVVRRGNDLLWWIVLERTESDDVIRGVGVGATTIQVVLAAVGNALAVAGAGARIAVEGIVPPVGFKDGHRDPISPKDAIATGIVLGGILATHPTAVVIPPNNHGRGLLATYPADLVTEGERKRGLNREAGRKVMQRHARAAWDCAGSGATHAAAARRHQILTRSTR